MHAWNCALVAFLSLKGPQLKLERKWMRSPWTSRPKKTKTISGGIALLQPFVFIVICLTIERRRRFVFQCKHARIEIKAVLPAPLWPSKQVVCPLCTVKSYRWQKGQRRAETEVLRCETDVSKLNINANGFRHLLRRSHQTRVWQGSKMIKNMLLFVNAKEGSNSSPTFSKSTGFPIESRSPSRRPWWFATLRNRRADYQNFSCEVLMTLNALTFGLAP